MKKIIVLCLLALPVYSLCQAGKKANIEFADGTVITAEVDDKEWITNPATVKIKKPGSATFETYGPDKVKSFEIDGGDRFVGALVSIDATPSEFEGPAFEQALVASIEKHVFLLVQFSSPAASIYSLRYNNRLHLYYSSADNPQPRELIYREYTVRKFEGIFKEEDKSYISQLGFLTDNCPDMKNNLATLGYSSSAMIKFMTRYNKQCGGSTTSYSHTIKQKGKFTFSAIAGVMLTNVEFNAPPGVTNQVGVVTNGSLESSTSPLFGGRIGYIIPRGHQKFNILFDLFYSKVNTSRTETVYDRGPSDYHIKTLTIDFTYINSNFGLRYFLVREKNLRPFIQGGIAYSVMLSENSEVKREVTNFGPTTNSTESPFPKNSVKKQSFYTFAGAGITIRKAGLEYRFMPMGAITRFSSIGSNIKSHEVVLSYQLN